MHALPFDALPLGSLGLGGIVLALLVGVILWKVLKLAFKVAVFIVVAGGLALFVGAYLQRSPPALPTALSKGASKDALLTPASTR